MKELSFCPRNPVLQKMVVDQIRELLYDDDYDQLVDKIIVHHLTTVGQMLQVEYEERFHSGEIYFRRTYLML